MSLLQFYINQLKKKKMIQMYLTDKLKEISNHTKRVTANLIKAAENLDIKAIQASTEHLSHLKDDKKRLTEDCVKYCTVAEVIAICKRIDKYSGEVIELVTAGEIAYEYKYHSKPVTVEEREMLVKAFGYHLKDAKV
jgi:hypothetical protein